MHRGERLDQREAKSGAFLGADMLALHLLERLAEALQILGRDADAGIGHRDLDAARRRAPRAPSPCRRAA